MRMWGRKLNLDLLWIVLILLTEIKCKCFKAWWHFYTHAVCGCGCSVSSGLTWLSCSASSQPSRAKHTVWLHWGHTQIRSRIVCTTAEKEERQWNRGWLKVTLCEKTGAANWRGSVVWVICILGCNDLLNLQCNTIPNFFFFFFF